MARGSVVGLLVLAGCTPSGSEWQWNAEDKASACAYEVDFKPDDPNDYLWTVEVADSATQAILGGYAEVHFRRYGAGINPESGEPVQSGRILSKAEFESPGVVDTLSRLYEGTYWSAMTLAKDVSYQDLIEGAFRFYAVRSTDQFALPSCVRSIKIGEAVEAHNGLLDHPDGPQLDAGNITDPQVYFDMVKAQPGIVMLVNAGVESNRCNTPAEDNRSETRSVLSHLAVKITAKPNPRLIDPVVRQGVSFIDFALGKDDGSYCQTSPHDWMWQLRAYNAQVKVGNRNNLPQWQDNGAGEQRPGEGQTRDVKLEMFSGTRNLLQETFSDGLAAINVQVDPDDDQNPTQGDVVLEFAGKVGGALEFSDLVGGAEGPGITFRLRRDDWVSDLSYAECTVKLSVDQVRAAYESTQGSADDYHRIRIVPKGKAAAANEIEVDGCSDGWFADLGLGLVYLDIGVETSYQWNTHGRPNRPDISGIQAGRMQVLPVERPAPMASR